MLSDFTKGAQLEKTLRRLKPGEFMRVSKNSLLDILVPANPLDRQTPEYLAEWFRSRLPFYATTHEDTITGDWEFERPRLPTAGQSARTFDDG